MTDSWDEMRKAHEEEFFYKQNLAAIKRLQERAAAQRLSPVTGKPMQQVTYLGVNIDKCEESGGIWLDKGELEALIEASKASSEHGGALSGLLKSLWKK